MKAIINNIVRLYQNSQLNPDEDPDADDNLDSNNDVEQGNGNNYDNSDDDFSQVEYLDESLLEKY